MRIRIHDGHIIDPANRIDGPGTVYIENDRIIEVTDRNREFNPDREINAQGKLVCPGFIDLGARLREPGMEQKATIASESCAAVSAGITTICYPPDTSPVIDTSAVVELIHQRTAAINLTRIYPLGALTHGLKSERLADMYTLIEAGCIGVSNAGMPIENSELLRRALEYAAGFDISVFIQAEDFYLRNNGVMNEGAISTRLGLPPIPETAETVAVGKTLLLVEQTGARVHFCRLSSARSVTMIAGAKQSGLPVSADAGIGYLYLTEQDVDNYNVSCHMNPPLRTDRDRQALRQGLRDGSIDAVCSDHQPHDDDAKSAPFSLTEPGASTIEVLFPLMNELVRSDDLSMPEAIAAITVKPARILGLELGSLGRGCKADVVIIDPDRKWRLDKNSLISAGKNTPFDGREMIGKVTHTIINGQLVYEVN
jgi:dihydroorotase